MIYINKTARDLALHSVSDGVLYSFGVIMAIVLILGIFLNLVVIAVFRNLEKRRKNILNEVIISVSVCNFLQTIVAYPVSTSISFNADWMFEDEFCIADAFWVHWMALASINHLVVFSVERYLVIKSPASAPDVNSFYKKCLIIGTCWLYALFWSILPLFEWSSYGPEGLGISCSVNWQSRSADDISYTILLMIFAFIIPMGIICFAYVKIYQLVKSHNKSVARMQLGMPKSNMEVLDKGHARKSSCDLIGEKQSHIIMCKERRVAKIGFIMASAFGIAWIPYSVVSMMAVKEPSSVSPLMGTIPAIIAKSSTCYFPIIFGLTHTAFRRELFRILRGRRGLDMRINSL